MCCIAIVNRTWGDYGKLSQNAQPQNEILCPKGFGGAALNKQSGGENHGRILPSAGRVY